jgi:hypothetical protein
MKSIVFGNVVYDLPYEAFGATSAYIDLRAHPAKIDEIPELKSEPRLKPLISLLNAPGGMFMTHGCAVASRPPGIPGQTEIRIPYGAKDAPCWYSSYIVFSFWHLNQNKKSRYEEIHRSYPPDRNQFNVCFEVGPAYFTTPDERALLKKKGSDTNEFICDIWTSGWGSNAKEAHDRWSNGIDDLTAFFANLRLKLDDLFTDPGITISQQMFGDPESPT